VEDLEDLETDFDDLLDFGRCCRRTIIFMSPESESEDDELFLPLRFFGMLISFWLMLLQGFPPAVPNPAA